MQSVIGYLNQGGRKARSYTVHLRASVVQKTLFVVIANPLYYEMQILWKYFKLQQGWVVLALVLATIGQLLSLTDPIIFVNYFI